MLFGPDWLANAYLSIFLFGLLFTVVSVAMGAAGAGGADGHGGIDADGGDAGGGHDGPSVLNLPTVLAFITWFGGTGFLVRQLFSTGIIISSLVALACGFVGGAIMFALLTRVLWPMMTKPMSTGDFDLPGTPARVVSPIRAGGVGEIVYSKGGSRFTSGARGTTDAPIDKGAEVVIVRYQQGLAYVEDVERLLSSDAVAIGDTAVKTE